MTAEEIIKYCLSKHGTHQDFPFGPEPLVIKVVSKMFILISDKRGKMHISLKCDPFIAESLRQEYPAITPGYHLNKQHWNTVAIDASVPEQEIRWMIDHSYDLVAKSLTKAEKEAAKLVLAKE